jgi:hypothetical protein
MLNPAPRGRRYLALYKFFCDESYDSDPKQDPLYVYDLGSQFVPRSYVVAGFFAADLIWEQIENDWNIANSNAGVKRYHAVEVNARSGEFEGWDKDKQISYSIDLLKALKRHGRMLHAVSCGMLPREYEDSIDDLGREKLGHPYIACFKSCVSLIARAMDSPLAEFQDDDKFSVMIDRSDFQTEAVDIFYKLKDHAPFGHCLATCTPGDKEEVVSLQPADLIAYETYRLFHDPYKVGSNARMRKAMQEMFPDNGFIGYYFDKGAFEMLKEPINKATCVPNGFVVNFPEEPPEPESGTALVPH